MIKQANDKLLNEMELNEHPSIERIHVWLNQNMNEEITKGVIDKSKTIQTCYKFVEDNAKKIAFKNAAMIEDDDVFKMVVDYYTDKEITVKRVDTPKEAIEKKKIKFEEENKALRKKNQELQRKVSNLSTTVASKGNEIAREIIPKKPSKKVNVKKESDHEQMQLFD